MEIRLAIPNDSKAILGIYAQYIDTPVTFECRLPGVREFEARIATIMQHYPWLVAVEDGQIVGYAYAHRQMEREAYQWNAELSVYLDRSRTARGLGKRLYGTLIGILRLQGIRTVYGVVTVPNAPSERLHAAMGFRHLGTFCKTGYKGSCWHDVAWYGKQIAPYGTEPAPFIPLGGIAPEKLEAVVRESGPYVPREEGAESGRRPG